MKDTHIRPQQAKCREENPPSIPLILPAETTDNQHQHELINAGDNSTKNPTCFRNIGESSSFVKCVMTARSPVFPAANFYQHHSASSISPSSRSKPSIGASRKPAQAKGLPHSLKAEEISLKMRGQSSRLAAQIQVRLPTKLFSFLRRAPANRVTIQRERVRLPVPPNPRSPENRTVE